MKIRTGFVSNSSTTSFTIYGWSEKVLSEHIGKSLLAFSNVELTIDEETFCENIEKLWSGDEWDVVSCRNESHEYIFGIGSAGEEVDHDMLDPFEFDEPTKNQKKELDAIAEELKLPAPSIYQEVFYDG